MVWARRRKPRMYNTSLEEGREIGASERLIRRFMVAIN
jgi:hypothetical protein